ncbi:MAG: glutathione S-transferase N-terminal domain-containing protein [Rubellimicrobium sp.]|nr:glutathione S-transferase N-terminal domain-containing protein [Rubellimicrobium sp.]
MTIRLHCFGESGHSYKVALALALTGTPWEAVKVDFFDGVTRGADYRALNVMGEAPVLEDGDLVLTQSGVIQDYLVGKTGQLGWTNEAERREVWRWILFDNHKVSSQVGAYRFQKNFLPEDKRKQDVLDFLQGRLLSALAVLEARLQGRDWLATSGPSIADLACCGYLFYPEDLGFERAEFPHVADWLGRIAALPGWAHPYDLMPGNPSDRA